MPLVRYEGLAIALPAGLWWLARGGRGMAAAALALGLGALAAFSLWLHARSGAWLPTSVLAKVAEPGVAGMVAMLRQNFERYTHLAVAAALLAGLAWPRDRLLALVFLAAALGHFLFGRYGWFGRYEAYIAAFIAVPLLRLALEDKPWRWPLVFVLPLAFPFLLQATLRTPHAMRAIWGEQAQVAAILTRADGPAAVQDLGLVAFSARHYVLDLVGLASAESLAAQRAAPDGNGWTAPLLARHGIHFMALARGSEALAPAGWIRAGTWSIEPPRASAAALDVVLYGRDAKDAARLRMLALQRAASGEARSAWFTPD